MQLVVAALWAVVGRFAQWIAEYFADARRMLLRFAIAVGIVIAILAWIPWGDWASDLAALIASVPPGVTWGFELFKVREGVSLLVSAWVLRFLLRWIRGALAAA